MKHDGNIRVNAIDWISLLLVIVGALNWGLVGIGMFLTGQEALQSWNLVNLLLGSVPTLEAIVYLLVGLAGLYELYFGYQLYDAHRRRTTTTTT